MLDIRGGNIMKILKKIVLIVVALSFLAALCGCNEVKKAESALNSTVTALQAGDFTTASNYIDCSEILDNNEMFGDLENGESVMKALFEQLSCKINSSEQVDKDNVKINADITNIDTSAAFQNTISQVFSLAFSGEDISEDEMKNKIIEIFTESLSSEDTETVTNTVDINMVKTEDGWKIDADKAVQDAITGGLLSAAENMGNAFGQ